jgi:hypothetical protein
MSVKHSDGRRRAQGGYVAGCRLTHCGPRASALLGFRRAPAVARRPAQNVRKSAQKVLERSALL